ncbi:MAG TPA: glycoside hydrolase family 130 protein [Caulobacteraceae bacterium]|nr:glycoside hydrolase family 130 protein [Caulobacteraceae bacterium]
MQLLEILPRRLSAEPGRVVIRPFQIAPEPRSLHAQETSRVRRIVTAVLDMDMRTCQSELALVTRDFGERHWQTREVFLQRFEQVREDLNLDPDIREERKELIGAYFCHEYSYGSAALMNPSVVPHPDQSGMVKDSVRVVISLRAVGEGHISSIAFREGILNHRGGFDLASRPPFSVAARVIEAACEANGMVTKAERFQETSLSGTVIFPFTQQQRNGLEDLRLVRLEDEAGGPLYCGTYTAYSGFNIASEMLITRDFRDFELRPILGTAARNKGMALFPRKIDGRYAMIGRQDGENLFYLTSDDLLNWGEGESLLAPAYPWELVQIGNCGSPIEIDEGWLMLTHGVGAMRKYSIGAVLLDKRDPRKVLARTVHPIISPSDEDREGYVPNVVYTCGAMAHGRRLFMPFGVADSSVAFSFVDLDELLAAMAPTGKG